MQNAHDMHDELMHASVAFLPSIALLLRSTSPPTESAQIHHGENDTINKKKGFEPATQLGRRSDARCSCVE